MYDDFQRLLACAADAQQTQHTAHDRVHHEKQRPNAVLDVEGDSSHTTYFEKGVVVGMFERLVRHQWNIHSKFAVWNRGQQRQWHLHGTSRYLCGRGDRPQRTMGCAQAQLQPHRPQARNVIMSVPERQELHRDVAYHVVFHKQVARDGLCGAFEGTPRGEVLRVQIVFDLVLLVQMRFDSFAAVHFARRVYETNTINVA
mmetsp:Transcript_58182/g.102327  ORF Transcript_58182/g.102327 Transcript_58182/m.102327 type:complete len:200 (+) Transcript_58182:195-794(+)